MMTSSARLLILIAMVLFFTTTVSASEARTPTIEYLGRHAGYHNLTRSSHGAGLFYFYFPSTGRTGNEPLVMWLQGGPGSADEFGLFYLNGPVHLNDDMSLKWNEFSWHKAANILYIDQPVGTGFSSFVDKNDLCHDEDCVSNDLYAFLQAFLKKNPGLDKYGFYITGESYAGHYIPAFASRIRRGNKAKEGIHVNLKGVAIGNGWTNPEVQYSSLIDYALKMNVINTTVYDFIGEFDLPTCLTLLKQCGSYGSVRSCNSSYFACEYVLYNIRRIGGIDWYDVRKKCKLLENCDDISPTLNNFLNKPLVKHNLGMGNKQFSISSEDVSIALRFDRMKNLDAGILELVKNNIKVLIYAGEYDLICNWIGNLLWVEALEWWGKDGFVASTNTSFMVDGVEAGVLKTYGPLSFLKVHNAGHMVPGDQPKVALEMLRKWMSGKLSSI